MTLNEALKILNLNENYTEDDLKKSYRALIIKYHPDKHPENNKSYAENKTKLINEAKDVLEKALKNRNTANTYNNSNNFNNSNNHYNNSNYQTKQNYTQEFLNLLKKSKDFVVEEYNTINSISSYDKIFMKHKYDLLDILDSFLSRLTVIDDEETLKKEYQSFFNRYNRAITDYYLDFSNSVYMGEDNNLWTIHYCDTLKEVRDVMFVSINNELDKEIIKYSSHKYYQNILLLLNKMKIDMTSISMYGLCKIEIIKEMFKTFISNEFREYKERKEIVENINIDISTYIEMRYQSFRHDIFYGDNFYKLYKQKETIYKTKSKIRKIFKIN